MMNITGIKQPKLLMFDYGGTIDTNGIHWSEVIWTQYQIENVPVNKEQFQECYIYTERELGRQSIINTDDVFLDVLRKKIDIQTSYLVEHEYWTTTEVTRRAVTEHISLRCNNFVRNNIDRVRETLYKLANKYQIIIVSNFYGNLQTVLKDYKLDMFQDVIESASVGIRKPDSEIYRYALKKIGIKCEDAIMIGDSIKNDINPANEVGCQTIWLEGKGWNNEQNYESVSTQNIKDLCDLKNYL